MHIKTICEEKLQQIPHTEAHEERLALELREVNTLNEADYFLSLAEKGDKYENENNLIIPYLLGICDEFDITKPPCYEYGEFPDIDIDYLPSVRQYLKEEFSREKHGKQFVCNIATYTTFGLRSALIDMAKVFGLDRKEILSLTTKLGIKDDEGEILTWEKAIELYEDLRKYLEQNPEMAEAAKKMLHRNRNMGMHASGLIISGVPIEDFVPLVKVKDGTGACSAWVEGLHGTDLGAVGLVKFDFLSLEANMKIATGTKLAGEIGAESFHDSCNAVEAATKHVGRVAALPGKSNWTDTSYLEDPVALEMANRGDLKMVFQYDGSEGIRRLAKQGGVTSFNDLAVYTALFRPSAIKLGMHEAYCRRKNKLEEYEIHPLVKDFMEPTYAVMVFQEQVMRMLNVVGKIPLKDCEAVRKAISKKKIEKFQKYKEIFVANGQETLQWPIEKVANLWNQIEAFSGYGFNLAHCVAYTYISSRMLYLKAHHPLAFYASVLSFTKAASSKDYFKLKDYKQEAERHGIRVNQVNINKSGVECRIVDKEIYYGLGKLRGIGEEIAERVVKLQPFKDYTDFISRAGTEAKIHQPVIALRMFDEDPIKLYNFYQAFKVTQKKEEEREKRLQRTLTKYREKIKELTGKEEVDDDVFLLPDETKEEVLTLIKKISLSTMNYQSRSAPLPKLYEFNNSEENIDPEYLKLLKDKTAAEEHYYGFVWNHPLEKCPKYGHHTFEEFESNQTEVGPIDIQINKVQQMKGPKATYYRLDVEDANSEKRRVTVWTDDFKRFKEELVAGRFIRLTVKAPSNGFPTFTLVSSPNRYRKPPKELDTRVYPLDTA